MKNLILSTRIAVILQSDHAFEDGRANRLLSNHEQYERLGGTAEERQRAYRELLRSELDSGEFGEIRDTVNRG
jgi:hypothetical protein